MRIGAFVPKLCAISDMRNVNLKLNNLKTVFFEKGHCSDHNFSKTDF